MTRSGSEDRSIAVVGIHGKVVGLARKTGAIVWENGLAGGGYGEVFLVVTGGQVFASALGRRLFCLDYRTGAMLWESETSGAGRASIVVEDDLVLVSKGGQVDCFERDGSEHLWTQPLKGKSVGRAALGFPDNVAQADDPGGQ